MRAYLGSEDKAQEVPEERVKQAASLREKLVEAAAESNDELLTKYLEGEELAQAEMEVGLRRGILAGTLVPVLAGSAIRAMGLRRLLESVVRLFPSPKDL